MLSLQRVDYTTFDEYALRHPKGNFHQTSKMGKLRDLMGWDVHPLMVFEGETPIGALLLAGKERRYEVTMGPLFDFSNKQTSKQFLEVLCQYAKKQKAAVLELYPYELYQTRDSTGKVIEKQGGDDVIAAMVDLGWSHKGFTVDYDIAANRWVFVKDLAGLSGEAELLASYRQTTRQTIRKLNPAAYSVKKMPYEELSIVQNLIDSSNEKNSVATRPLEYYERLFIAFGEDIEFLVVYHEEKTPLSAGIFIKHPNEMVYFMSGADTEYRHLYGGHFLQHHVMLQCIERGVARYNFYGVSGHFSNNPLLVYKAGFRGAIEEYVGGFTKPLFPGAKLVLKAGRAVGKIKRLVRS